MMNPQKKKIKKLKPQECECTLKYVCRKCHNSHWLFLREAQVKNYKIVCECGEILLTKRIANIDIVYDTKLPIPSTKPKINIPPVPPQKPNIDILRECGMILRGMGYSDEEIDPIVVKAIDVVRADYIKTIIEYSLRNIGDSNV